jgi:Ca-activated chloride channel family protein
VSPVDFGSPLLRTVAAATVVLLVVVVALDFTRRRRALERMGHVPRLLAMMPALSPTRRILRAALLVTGISLVAFALARPQVEGATDWRQRGMDVAIVMDFSKSMLAHDVYPSRIERAKVAADTLLAGLEGDRVAIVAFAGAAAHFPLTHDHRAARLLYEELSPLDLPPGSDLGEAIRVGRCVVRPALRDDRECDRLGGRGRGGAPLEPEAAMDEPRPPSELRRIDRARALVLLTDGEDTEGRAADELRATVERGIHVYVVGVGTTTGELIPELGEDGAELGWKKAADGSGFVTTRLQEALLSRLAAIAGGDDHYFRLGRRHGQVEALASRLGSLKKGDLDERVVKIPEDVYQWLLVPAFVLLLAEVCFGERRRRPAVEEPA